MDLSELKELMQSVVDHDISEFEYEESGIKIRIKRNHLSASANTVPPALPLQDAPPLPASSETVAREVLTAPAPDTRDGEGLHAVVSPIVGTFYNAATPGADPYVRVGDIVQEGSVLCIVEAMKLMNEIKSDVAGKIVDILVTNGQPVEYGQKLYLIQARK